MHSIQLVRDITSNFQWNILPYQSREKNPWGYRILQQFLKRRIWLHISHCKNYNRPSLNLKSRSTVPEINCNTPTKKIFLELIYSPFLLSVRNSIAEQVFHHVFPSNLLVVDKLLQCKLELRKNVWIHQPSENESLTLVGLKMIISSALSPDT